MIKMISLKNLSDILLGITILLMLVVVILQKQTLKGYNINKQDVNAITTITGSSTPNVSPDSALLSEEKILEYEKTIALLKSQINEIQSNNGSKGSSKDGDLMQSAMPDQNNNNPIIEPFNESFRDQEVDRFTRVNFILFYEPFLKKLGLFSEDIQKLKELYLTKKMYERDIGNIDRSDKLLLREIQNELELFNDEYEENVMQILGKTNYEKYDIFEKSLSQRSLVVSFNESLNMTDQLDRTKTEELIIALYEKHNDVFFRENSPGKNITSYQEIMALMEKEYLKTAKEILSDIEYQNFINFYEKNNRR